MKVKAKTNIKYGTEWFTTGMTFNADEADVASFGDAVEVVAEDAAQPAPVEEKKTAEAEKEPEVTEPEAKQEPDQEPEQEPAEKPKATSTRRRKISE